MSPKTVLIVDDEEPLLASIQDGFTSFRDQFRVETAINGKRAVDILESTPISMVITDLRMPVMDGFELLAYLNQHHPAIPAIVMTAFNTPELEQKILGLNPLKLIEKPIDLDELTQAILQNLPPAGPGATLTGISLPSILQLLEMEEKTCLLDIQADANQKGQFYFHRGVLFDASLGNIRGEEAVYRMMQLGDVGIGFKPLPKKKYKKRIKKGLMPLLMEGTRRIDENRGQWPAAPDPMDPELREEKPKEQNRAPLKQNMVESNDGIRIEAVPGDCLESSGAIELTKSIALLKGEKTMAEAKEILGKFREIEGFKAVGIFTPQGEMAAEVNVSGEHLAELGALANDVLLKAQKATDVMGVGRGNMVHIQAPQAQVIARCLNESNDYSATAAGKAHIHMVLVLENNGSLAMGKMKLESIIQELAPIFR